MKGDVELTPEDIASKITIKVSAKKAVRSLAWRMKLAKPFLKTAAWITGFNLKIDVEV